MTASHLETPISWTKTGDAEFPFRATDADGEALVVRLNDFPEEPMYTLLRNSVPLESFDDWPKHWRVES
ncbi:hypothetical protein [Variovorax paradoxus]|jgi:hypothetical protein|uniref:Uncharacterized protein n=1 Tax=Variovorax paradoxus (strain S110) TaxID=543728 RepID=C5D0G2_VARPS|nr:hypothetical protein [Variovorax paradoxus]MBW8719243.1 hypothetical protein [Variovorax paradoxus]